MLLGGEDGCGRGRVSAAHLLPGQQEVLVDVGSQKACIAVTFHELEYVLLQQGGEIMSTQQPDRKGEDG